MAKRRTIRTVAGVVKAFGGNRPIAQWANVGHTTVSMWVARDYIPPGWHWRMANELGQMGYDVDPEVFGVNPNDHIRRVA